MKEILVDNFNQISSLLVFKPGIYYYLQVIQRKKDHPDLSKRDFQLYSKCITSSKEFLAAYDISRVLCDEYGARCYISLLPRSIDKFTKFLQLELSSRISKDNYSSKVFRAPDSTALSSDTVNCKGVLEVIMLDIDDISFADPLREFLVNKGVTILEVIPSVSGIHFICKKFYPGNLGKDSIENFQDKDNWKLVDSEVSFTLRRDVNVILYANIKR